MTEAPWLTLIGLGEDGPAGLSPASAAALAEAEIIVGPPRHLAILGPVAAETRAWPVPFADGLPMLDELRGRRVAMLVSGNPFWFGAGSSIAGRYDRSEWRALPATSVFSLAASRLGWPLQDVPCLGLHAAPLSRLRPHLSPGIRLIATLRDGSAVRDLADYLIDAGFGASTLTVLEALGGPRERITDVRADALTDRPILHPVCAAISVAGDGACMPRSSGIDDALFETDGQITRRPVRALSLSALAPRPFERLWDIGGGSGSVAIEWLLAHPTTEAISIEARADRAARIAGNAAQLGVDRLNVVEGTAPEALSGLPLPDAIFVGGGLSDRLMFAVTDIVRPGTRLVANAVTLESEALLTAWQARRGGTLLRIELSQAAPLGPRLGWRAALPVVQWSVTL